VFPFGVVFDRRLTIIYVGRTLQKLFDAESSSRQQSRQQSRRPSRQQSRRPSASHGQSADAPDGRHPAPRQNVQLVGQPLAHHFSLIRPQMTELTWHDVRSFPFTYFVTYFYAPVSTVVSGVL